MELNWKTEFSKDGYEIVKVKIDNKYKYIGSKYNQKKEIDKFKENLGLLKSNDIYIIFGLSCGEHLKELLKIKKSKNRILVIEHNEELIEYVKNKYDFINDEKFIITSREDYIRSYIASIKSNLVDNTRIVHYSNYSKIFIEKVRESFAIIKDGINSIIIDRNTELLFEKIWFDTLISNIKYSSNATPINKFKNKFFNNPAFIVSAGPSLEKNIHELKKNKNGIILTGGRTLRSLLDEGIEPDLFVGLDSADESYQLVKKRLDKLKVPLLFNETTNKDIVKNHKSKKLIYGDRQFIKSIWGVDGQNFVSGGSVAHAITSCAIFLGCNPIVFVGQDLAYTDNKGHAKIAYNELNETIKNLDDTELFDTKYKKNSDIYVTDINGGVVRTSIILNDFKKSFEQIIENNKQIKFIDATEGGAFIKGSEVKSLKEVIESLNYDDMKKENFKELIHDSSVEDEVKQYIDNLQKQIKKFINKCNQGLNELEKLKFNYLANKDVNKYIKNLDKIDLELRDFNQKVDILNSLLYKEIYNIENDDELLINNKDSKIEVFNKIYNKNKKIYTILKEKLESANGKIADLFNNKANCNLENTLI